MSATFNWYNRATKYIGDGTYEAGSPQVSIASQPFYVALLTSSYTFSAAHNVYADLTNELSTGGGYTAGGGALASITFVQATAVTNFDAADFVWTASAGGIPAFRGAAIYVNATVNSIVKPLLCFIDNNGSDVPATSAGNTLTFTLNATGLFQVTHS